MRCRELEPNVDSYLDGEFAAPERLELEAHLSQCCDCQRLVEQQRVFKKALREGLRAPLMPTPLRQNICALLDNADRAAAPPRTEWLWQHLRKPLGVTLPVIAAGMLIVGYLTKEPEQVINESIVRHERNLPMEVTGAHEVVRSWFDGKVPFAVPPPRLEPIASLRGGRLSHLGDREAAYLVYDRPGGRRISVFVFDGRDFRISSMMAASAVPGMPRVSAPRRQVIRDHEVYMEGSHGYPVAVFRDRGLAYAITGSVDEPELYSIVSAAVGGP